MLIKFQFIQNIKILSVAFMLVLMFSCESNMNEIRKINVVEFSPVGEAKDFNLKYTDSGKIKVVLVSKQMLDFSQLEFPFTEFPKGLQVTIYDDNANKNYVTADYAVSYTKTSLIDLSGNVKITTFDGKLLETEQLYFDQKNNWFFTQKPYTFTNNGNIIRGLGIDFSKDFKTLDTQATTGVYSL